MMQDLQAARRPNPVVPMDGDSSSSRTIDVFFYGLYLDPQVLATKHVQARSPRRGHVEGFALRLGSRATLLRAPGARTLGMVYAIDHAALGALYESLEVYRPEPVLVHIEPAGAIAALTMVLLDPPAPDESNPEYASKLQAALQRLGFPSDYIAGIR